MRNKFHMLGLMAIAMMDMATLPREEKINIFITDEERKRRLAKAEIERHKANGLKEFFYGENSLYARNQKNADRKARNKHWL